MRRDAGSESEVRPAVPFREAVRLWLKIGFISFGGPAGQIAILHREVVERRGWITEERFLHALNYCMLLPGPEAQQLATYVGWLLHRTRGALVAGILFVAPSILILLALSYGYALFGAVPLAAGALAGLKAVVVALILEAVVRIGRRSLRRPAHVLLAGGAFVAIHFLHVPFPAIVLAAALAGLAAERIRSTPRAFEPKEQAPGVAAHDAAGGALRETRAAARPLRTAAAGLALWGIPCAALGAWLGWGSLPVKQYLFYTGAAFVTFGGAYAVLAYVIQAAVHAHAWITPAQAADGLALAETTPGPLIMVLQFVGFMTGWNNSEGMDPLAAAALGAIVATWTTFLPSILFVLLGAPYMEVLRGNRTLGAALSGITASVIGVVLNLAIVFGAAVILPQGAGGIDWFAAVVAVAAFAALRTGRVDVLWVVLGGGAAGLLRAAIS